MDIIILMLKKIKSTNLKIFNNLYKIFPYFLKKYF